jgi:hypothetical protein
VIPLAALLPSTGSEFAAHRRSAAELRLDVQDARPGRATSSFGTGAFLPEYLRKEREEQARRGRRAYRFSAP